MSEEVTYSIGSTGGVMPGHDPDDVRAAFSKLFGVPAEKASAFTDTQKLLKKGLSEESVESYRAKLTAIGLSVDVHAHIEGVDEAIFIEPPAAPEGLEGGLTVTPSVDEPKPQAVPASTAPSTAAPSTAAPATATATATAAPSTTAQATATPAVSAAATTEADGFRCPKCDLAQTPAKACARCGIIIEKFLAASSARQKQRPGASSTQQTKDSTALDNDDEQSTAGELNAKIFIVPVVVTIASAFLWKIIAQTFDLELGIFAWAIGGVIGFFAVQAGTRGHTAAGICAVLVVFAIFGGKYMFHSSWQQELSALLNDEMSGSMQEYVDTINYEAAEFAQIPKDPASIKNFMVEYEYSAASSAASVTDDQLADFEQHMRPMLESAGAGKTATVDTFLNDAVPELGAATSGSVWNLVFSSLGLLDFVFILLGCGTAFRLVSEAD